MSEPARMPIKDLITLGCALVGAIVVVGGAVRKDGNRDAQIDSNTRRIETLEHTDQTRTDLIGKIDGRTIRIETKLEMMAPPAKGPKP